ncbi:hypothetical protein XH81_16430 [Bradyrhizobium sp. CCBAU 25360]|uniref:ORC-CDC6 family AAA ATPase n=1 Tax=Bradyrhizobium sp. CCBAU 25360 TaxID=858425 RepID=UPI002305CF04|nr:hypothetical protein [Bradyrhizobium sp. CCBAU 25360]MDA9416424.1 hypothetical protein [Bradyrhizobium sp. CCBAU 25360]
MTRLPLNPFRPTRWEHQQDGKQLIWYTRIANNLADDKSIYVSGSRGSGKTTLLKSVCWEDLATNSSLRMQRKLEDFKSIGIYIRFPDHLTVAMSFVDWAKIYPDAPSPALEFHRFFSLLVELTCCERALHACHELRSQSLATFSPAKEREITSSFIAEFPRLAHFAHTEAATFFELARLLRDVVREMNASSVRGTVSSINERLPPREPGEMLSLLVTKLSNAVRLAGVTPSRPPGFKFCLDDCEVLGTAQQVSLNTLVRNSKFPVSWVVSYVGSLFENSRTYLEQQPLTDADRRVISLDSRNESDFRELCQAVVSLRLMFSVSEQARTFRSVKEVSEFFPLDARLGSRSVNDIMEQMIKRSTSPTAERLARNAAIVQRIQTGRINNAATPPLYQTYVLLHWQGQGEAFKTSFNNADEDDLERRAHSSNSPAGEAWLRRKQNAALLHLASTLGFKRLPLAGANVIVSLSDGSIRDFLEILGFIYEAYTKRHKLDAYSQESLDKFALARTTIANEVQTTGIYRASSAYHAGVSARGERDFDVVLRLIEGLGRYATILQSDHRDPSVMGRSERGIFQVRFEAARSERVDAAARRERSVLNVVRQAEIAGYLRMVDPPNHDVRGDPRQGQLLRFRLHRRLAPYYGFSYRGPYETVAVSASEIWQLCDRSSPVEPILWAESMAANPNMLDQRELSLGWDGDQ